MRTAVLSHVLTLILATAALLAPLDTASAATKHLNGTFSADAVRTDCINAGGDDTTTGSGGYGCKTKKGSVSCTSDGQCTGTCSNCTARTLRSGIRDDLPFLLKSIGRSR